MFFSPTLCAALGGYTCVTTVVGHTTYNRPLLFLFLKKYFFLWTGSSSLQEAESYEHFEFADTNSLCIYNARQPQLILKST